MDFHDAYDAEGTASGLIWENIGEEKPQIQELTNLELAKALESKTKFTQEEWDAFGIPEVHTRNIIKSGNFYFKPSPTEKGQNLDFHDVYDAEGTASGLIWENIGEEKPQIQELTNLELAKALESKTKFTQEEWDAFGIPEVHTRNIIKSGNFYFKPKGQKFSRQISDIFDQAQVSRFTLIIALLMRCPKHHY